MRRRPGPFPLVVDETLLTADAKAETISRPDAISLQIDPALNVQTVPIEDPEVLGRDASPNQPR